MATKQGNKYKTSVYKGSVGGKRQYEVFWGDTPDEADFAALQYKLKHKEKADPVHIKLGDAIDNYIKSRDAVLSPVTTEAYKSIRRARFRDLMETGIADINNRVMQSAINSESKITTKKGKKIQPKAVRNAAALIIAAIKYYDSDKTFKVVYPKSMPIKYATPDKATLQRIFKAVEGTRAEVPVLLSVWLSLSMSEILGLKWDNIHDDYITIEGAMVFPKGTGVYKQPKTYARNRNIIIDRELRDKIISLPRVSQYVVPLTHKKVYTTFTDALKKNNIPHCRFHDLRHANASIMALLNIPDRYAQERGGWSNPKVMKGVYQQTFTEEQKQFAEIINSYIKGILHT